MQSSNAPNKIQLPFAASGTKNTIPVPSQQGVTPGAASFTDGFPPLTFTPLSAGGVPPAGADFNGILNSITALQQWKSAGGQFPFDATFATAIGGYPRGATVLKADGTGLWISTAENNTANPDTGGAGWLAFAVSSVQAASYNSAPDTGAANAYAMTLTPAPAALTAGMIVTLINIKASNTGSSTLNVNGLGALPIVMSGGFSVIPFTINTGATVIFQLNATASAWTVVFSSLGLGFAYTMAASSIASIPYSMGAIIESASGTVYTWQGSSYKPAGLGVNGYSSNAYTVNTVYTNTSAWPIFVSAFNQLSTVGNLQLLVDGTIRAYYDTGSNYAPSTFPAASVAEIVPAGSTWEVAVTGNNGGAGIKIYTTL